MQPAEGNALIVSKLGAPADGERAVPLRALLVPQSVRIEGDQIVWPMDDMESKPVGKQLLRRFAALRDASDKDVCDFVRHWGPLQICQEHYGQPSGHTFTPQGNTFTAWEASHPHICVLPQVKEWKEPIGEYHRFARKAYGLMRCAALLQEGHQPTREDWFFALYGAPGVASNAVYSDIAPGLWIGLTMWLGSCPVMFGTFPSAGRVGQLWLGSFNPLYSALALQLAAAIAGNGGTGFCGGCMALFERSKAVMKGKAEYCSRCRRGVSSRKASQTYWKRHSKEIIKRRRDKRQSRRLGA